MNLLYLLRRARDQFGDHVALLHGDRQATWREFYERVERCAAFLRSSGLEHGDRMAVLLSNSPEYLELYYATAMAGIIIVPLNNRWSVEDCVFAITDSGTKALVVDARYLGAGRGIVDSVPSLHLIFVGGDECPAGMTSYSAGIDAAVPDAKIWCEPEPDDLVGIFYTSGTTGGPKGAMLTHRNICSNAILGYASGLRIGTRYLHAAPMFHLADGAATHVATMTGAAHAFLPSFDPGAYLAAVERYRATCSVLVPTMINMIVNHPSIDSTDLSSLERILYGASPMPIPLLQLAMKKLGCAFQQAYGMTETSPIQTLLQPEDHRFEDLDEEFAPVRSAGQPILGMEIRVVDMLEREVPTGEAGEIIARGDNVMKGYWNRPGINQEVLRGGWMHTGDLGAFDERGFLYVLDRKKDMIKSGGENVFSPEVESAIVSHEDVLEAAVIGVPHERWGETIRAIVVLRTGVVRTEAEIIGYCRSRITHFKCPTSIVFVDALPKGGTGKVQKVALRKLYGSASIET